MGQIKFFSLGLLIAISFVVFQNCGKSSGSSTESVQGANYIRSSTDTFSVLKVDEHGISAAGNRMLTINLEQSTLAISTRDSSGAGMVYALSDENKELLQSILAQSEVCEPAPAPVDKDQMCTMIYGYPYVELIDGDDSKKLGEKVNGCAIPTDLCDGKAQELRAALEQILLETKNLPY